MARLRQIPPTGGYPIFGRDLLRLFTPGNLAADFREFLAVPYARVTCSGTAAFYLTLEAIKTLTAKHTIVIPSFICPLVGLAVARAGLTLAVSDMQMDGALDYDYDALEQFCRSNADIAAIVVAHLGGMAADLARIKTITEAHGILLIEDCAQALGAEYNGKKTGTFGDFAFFSFARGKGLTLYEGGVLTTRHAQHAALLDATYERLVPRNWAMEISTLAGLFGYGVFYRPWLFWFIFDLTYLLWNRLGDEVRAAAEHNELHFPLYRMSALRQRLGHCFFHRVRPQISRQWDAAQTYFAALKNCSKFRVITELPNSRATYPYVTLVLKNRTERDKMLHRLRAQGLGAFIIYIRPLRGYDYMKPHLPPGDFPAAQHLADCTLTLTTSLYLTDADREKIIRLLTEYDHAA